MERLSLHQFKVLGVAVLIGTTVLPLPSLVITAAGRDGWMSVIPGYAAAIPYGLLLLSLLKKFPGKNLLEISEEVLGKWVGKGIGLFYIAVMTYFGGLVISQAGRIYTNTIMPLTPEWVFHLGLTILVLLIGLGGIEVLARFSEVVFPMFLLSMAALMLFNISYLEDGELEPILAQGIIPVVKGSLKLLPFAMEYILFLAALLPFLPSDQFAQKNMKKSILQLSLFAGALGMLGVIINILSFGPGDFYRQDYGVITLANMVELRRTMSGGESILEMFGTGAIIIKGAAYYLAAHWGIKTVFGLKSKFWCLALAGAFFSVALMINRDVDMLIEIELVDKFVILPFAGLWIPGIWIIARWRKRGQT